jgi:hypothetical protein
LLLLTEQSSLPKEIQILGTMRKLDGLLVDRQLALERHDNDALAQLGDKEKDTLRNHIFKCAETRLQMDFLEARYNFILLSRMYIPWTLILNSFDESY